MEPRVWLTRLRPSMLLLLDPVPPLPYFRHCWQFPEWRKTSGHGRGDHGNFLLLPTQLLIRGDAVLYGVGGRVVHHSGLCRMWADQLMQAADKGIEVGASLPTSSLSLNGDAVSKSPLPLAMRSSARETMSSGRKQHGDQAADGDDADDEARAAIPSCCRAGSITARSGPPCRAQIPDPNRYPEFPWPTTTSLAAPGSPR